jgi:pimeloyl-ACP methyl ester carboxylesterase
LLLIAPVFDTPRFGNLGGGFGGYRNLFGKHIPADEFVNKLVNRYSPQTRSGSTQFYLYGHSAGGQFVNRFVVTHPDKIIRAVISAAGRYSYPTTSSKWPYGAGHLSKKLKWKDGSKTNVSVSKSLRDYALAARKVSIVIGSKDTKVQPKRPAHKGATRIELAKSWAREMNQNAERYGVSGNVKVSLVQGVGHSSSALTPYCANVLFGN